MSQNSSDIKCRFEPIKEKKEIISIICKYGDIIMLIIDDEQANAREKCASN